MYFFVFFCIFAHVRCPCRWSFAMLDSKNIFFFVWFWSCLCVFLCVFSIFVHVTGALEGSARPYGGAEERRIGLGAPRPRQRARTIGESPVGRDRSWVRCTNATSVLPSPHASVVLGRRFMQSRHSRFFWNTRASLECSLRSLSLWCFAGAYGGRAAVVEERLFL